MASVYEVQNILAALLKERDKLHADWTKAEIDHALLKAYHEDRLRQNGREAYDAVLALTKEAGGGQ